MAYSHAKGRTWENTVADWVNGERRRLAGPNDFGDIAELGRSVVIECKAHNTYAFPTWIAQMQIAVRKAEARYDIPQLGLVAAKRIGSTKPEHAYWLINPANVPEVIRLWQRAR